MKSYPNQLFENEVLMEAADATLPTEIARGIVEDIYRNKADQEVFELFCASADLMKILQAEVNLSNADFTPQDPVSPDVGRDR